MERKTDPYQVKLSGIQKKQLRLLFLNPATTISKTPYVPLGIAYLVAILENNGIFVDCLDYQVEPIDFLKLKKIIKDKEINVVGITSSTPQIFTSYKLIDQIKYWQPQMTVLMGGIHPSVFPEEAISHGADVVIRGEGEATFAELVPALVERDEAALVNIRGISYRSQRGILHNLGRERIKDLDAIPFPARHLFSFPQKYLPFLKFKKQNFSAHLIGSRGCSGHCVFCNKQIFNQKITKRSAQNILKEIVMLKKKFGVQEVSFADDFFTYDIERVKQLCRLLIKNKVRIRWACSNTRVDSIDKEMFALMKASGCYRVLFGVESGNNQILKKIGKNITLSQVKKVFQLAKQAELMTGGYFMIGHHVDTPKTIKQTIHFARNLDTDAVQFAINTPFPGTASYRILKNKGWLLSENWENYQMFEKPLFHTDKLTPEYILKMYKKAWLSCYVFNPQFIIRHLKRLFSSRENFNFYLLALKQVLKRFLGKRLY